MIMRKLIIQTVDVMAYVAIVATVIFGYSAGAYFAGYDSNPIRGAVYALGAFCLASAVSGTWFCLSGSYTALQSLEREAIRARLKGKGNGL